MRYYFVLILFVLIAFLYACNKWDLDKGNENHPPIFTLESISDRDSNLIIYLDFKDLGYKNKLSDCGILFTNKGEPTSLNDSIRSLGGKEKNGRDSIVLPLDFNHIFYNIKAYAVNNDSLYLSTPNYIEPRRKWDAGILDTFYIDNVSFDFAIGRYYIRQIPNTTYEKGILVDTNKTFNTSKRISNSNGYDTDPENLLRYFQDSISGLINNKKYFVKAYLKDQYWTSFSNIDSFITEKGLPSFLSSNYTIYEESKNVKLEAEYSLGSENVEISKVGFQVSTSLLSLNNGEIIEATVNGLNRISVTLSDLQSEQQYYARAFIITELGEVYGDTMAFTSLQLTPKLGSITYSALTSTSLILNCSVEEDNSIPEIIERGFVYSTESNPSKANHIEVISGTFGNMSGSIEDLSPGTTYYIKAFASNNIGTTYSNQIVVTTDKGFPILGEILIDSVKYNSVKVQVEVFDSNTISDIIQRGFEFLESEDALIEWLYPSIQIVEGGYGIMDAVITNLKPSTEYVISGFAINNEGKANSNFVEFTTTSGKADLSNIEYYDVTSSSVSLNSMILNFDDIGEIQEKGYVYSKSPSPTVLDDKVSDIYHSKSLDFQLIELDYSSTYYVRGFVKNSNGTSYSQEVSFTTRNGLPTIGTLTLNQSNSFSCNLAVSIEEDMSIPEITARGFVYAKHEDPEVLVDHYASVSGNFGLMEKTIDGLSQYSIYYIRAYAMNEAGIVYSNSITFQTDYIRGTGVTDIDGNEYETVIIGSQEWMSENLRVTRLNDSSQIYSTNSTSWSSYASSLPASISYLDDSSYDEVYGKLYSGRTVVLNVCPTGWRVPSRSDFETLEQMVKLDFGNDSDAFYALKSGEGWIENGINLFGLNIGPAPKISSTPPFQLDDVVYYWTSDVYSGQNAFAYYFTDVIFMTSGSYSKSYGYPVRCLKE